MIFSKRYEELTPYVAGEQTQDKQFIKLNTNENPYPPSPAVTQILATEDSSTLRLYPDPNSSALRRELGKYFRLPDKQIFCGNGSDEVLSFIFFALFDSTQHPLLFPSPSYSFYPVYCQYYGIEYEPILLDTDFRLNIHDYLNRPSCGCIFPNPNAPTGILLGEDAVRELLENYPSTQAVVIDEAYIDFGGKSAANLLNQYENLVVVQTFSKSRSLAGQRVGFALANEKIIQALQNTKDSFNSYPLDTLTQKIAIASLKDEKYFKANCKKIMKTRSWFSEKMKNFDFTVLTSHANFVFVKHKQLSGAELYQQLKEAGILVRYFCNKNLDDYIRITIGTDDEMQELCKAIIELIN